MWLLLVLAAATASPASPPSSDRVRIVDRIERYAIAGGSSAELMRQMRELGPVDPLTGKRMQGFAEWRVSWSYQYAPGRGGCRLTQHEVGLDVVITLPDWRDKDAADGRMQAGWADFLQKLEEHERGHRAIGVEAAQAVDAALAGAPGRPDCDGLGEWLDSAAERAMGRYLRADAEYDLRTGHGQTQGVQLP